MCFFFDNLAAALKGGITPIIWELTLVLTLCNIWTEGVMDATTITLGL